MKTQHNLYQADHGGWVVEYRDPGEQWRMLGVYGSYRAAKAAYDSIRAYR